MNTLNTKLAYAQTVQEKDAFDECTIEIFGEVEELKNTEVGIHDIILPFLIKKHVRNTVVIQQM